MLAVIQVPVIQEGVVVKKREDNLASQNLKIAANEVI